jgi:Deacetylase PdaC/Protein of unknown function (DUF3298)
MTQAGRIAGFLAFLACMFGGFDARAEVSIENQTLQSGLFVQTGCKPEDVEGFNECACLADIHVPVIQGLADAEKEKQLNATFRSMAEKQKCEGKETQSEEKDEPASFIYNFEITYQSAALLGLRYESWSYTGGAHGNGTVEGMLIDLAQGSIIPLSDIFAATELPALNKYIYDALSAEPEGEVFHDAIEGFKGEFVTPAGCTSCTVALTDEGIKVIFQTYAVASFASGPMEVLIPEKLVSHPALSDALKNLKPVVQAPETE